MFLNDRDEEWVLYYLSSGKGMMPYQMITKFDFLKIKPKNGVFLNKVISTQV